MTDARARIHAMLPVLDSGAEAEAREKELDALLDEHRIENRNEAADWFASYVRPTADSAWVRGCDAAVAWVVSVLRNPQQPATAPAVTAAPEFFQVGHTYTEPDGSTDWKFRVDHITTRPEDGERTAIGWRHFRGEWDVYAYGEDDWEIHQHVGYIDVTEAGGNRG